MKEDFKYHPHSFESIGSAPPEVKEPESADETVSVAAAEVAVPETAPTPVASEAVVESSKESASSIFAKGEERVAKFGNLLNKAKDTAGKFLQSLPRWGKKGLEVVASVDKLAEMAVNAGGAWVDKKAKALNSFAELQVNAGKEKYAEVRATIDEAGHAAENYLDQKYAGFKARGKEAWSGLKSKVREAQMRKLESDENEARRVLGEKIRAKTDFIKKHKPASAPVHLALAA